MKAWRVHPGGVLQLDRVPVPEEPRGWTNIAVSCFQVSVTEMNALAGRPGYAPELVHEKMSRDAPAAPFGHEFCGTVLSAPRGSRFERGNRVAALGQIGRSVVGLDLPGCFAEQLRLPDDALVAVGDAISDHAAAALQPLSSALACFRSAAMKEESAVVIFGLGTMGLFLIQLSQLAGARKVVAVGRRSEQLEAALSVGATHAVDIRADDAPSRVRDATGNNAGIDVFFEAAGATEGSSEQYRSIGLELGLEVAAPGATVVQVGHYAGAVQITPSRLRRKSIRYVFPDFAARDDLERAVSLVTSGDVEIQASHVLEGIESLPRALELTQNKAAHQVVGSVQVRVRRQPTIHGRS